MAKKEGGDNFVMAPIQLLCLTCNYAKYCLSDFCGRYEKTTRKNFCKMLVFSIVSGIFAKYIIRKFVPSPLGDFVGVGDLTV